MNNCIIGSLYIYVQFFLQVQITCFIYVVAVVPAMTRSDKGTENGLLATCQMFLRRNCSDSLAGSNSHVYGSSMRNQVEFSITKTDKQVS